MNEVYRHQALAPDEYLGHVAADGRVYEHRSGPDRYIGRVELENGKIFESRLGPDRQIGHIDLSNGRVYLDKLGPDEYLGSVRSDGKLYLHRAMASDEYLGKVKEMASLAHGGGAFLLLVLPAHDEAAEAARAEDEVNDADTGPAVAPA